MILPQLSVVNYKNIAEATLQLSPKINCFIGHNGAGKTNVLDAIFFLSLCHSAQTTQDSLAIRHGEDFFMLEGNYLPKGEAEPLNIYCRKRSSFLLSIPSGARSRVWLLRS